jgi:PAS domain S-box-containing protein
MSKAPGILPHILIRVLPITTLVLLSIWISMRIVVADTVRRDAHDRVAVEAENGARLLGARLHNIMESVEHLARNNLLINALIDTTARENYLPLFFQSLRIPGPHGVSITLGDYRGRRVASNRRDAPGYVNVPWLDTVMNGKTFLRISAEGLEAAVPVLYGPSAEGMVAVSYGPGQVSKILSLSAAKMVFAVFDNHGSPLFASAGAPWKTAGTDSGAPTPGWIETRRHIPGFGDLTLLCGEPAATAFAPLGRLDIFFLAAMCLSLPALAVAVFLAVRMVARPLSDLAGDMDSITGLSGPAGGVSESGPAEFRKLGRSFNRLMGHLALSTEKLRESEATARAILNASPAAIVLLDREGVVLDCNDAYPKRFGISRESLMGSGIWDLFPGEISAHRKTQVKGVFNTGEPFRGEDERDGMWNEYSIEPAVRGPDGQVMSVLVEALDITTRKRLEEQARLTDEQRAMEAGRAQMSAMVLHQIGNAVTPVKVYVEEMADETRNTSLDYLEKVYLDLREHRHNLPVYLNEDQRGRRVFEYMKVLIVSLKRQARQRQDTVQRIDRAFDRISEMLDLQQSYIDNGTKIAGIGLERDVLQGKNEHGILNEEQNHG